VTHSTQNLNFPLSIFLFRLDHEFVVKGYYFHKGRMKITVSKIFKVRHFKKKYQTYNLHSVWLCFHSIYIISFCIVIQSQYNLCSVWFCLRLVYIYMITFCYAIQSKYNLRSVCTFTFTLFSQTPICLFSRITNSVTVLSVYSSFQLNYAWYVQ